MINSPSLHHTGVVPVCNTRNKDDLTALRKTLKVQKGGSEKGFATKFDNLSSIPQI